MEKAMLTPEFILYMTFILYAENGISDELFLFIIPAITAQCLSMAVKCVTMSVEDAKNAMFVAFSFEVIAIHQMILMVMSDDFIISNVMRFIVNCWFIGMMGVIFYRMSVMVISEKSFWMRFILTCWGIVIMGFTCASVLTVLSGYMKS